MWSLLPWGSCGFASNATTPATHFPICCEGVSITSGPADVVAVTDSFSWSELSGSIRDNRSKPSMCIDGERKFGTSSHRHTRRSLATFRNEIVRIAGPFGRDVDIYQLTRKINRAI